MKRGARLILVLWGLLLVFAGTVLAYSWAMSRSHGAPVSTAIAAQADPRQVMIPADESTPIRRGGWVVQWTLQPRAHYRVEARVLSAKTYAWDLLSGLVPLDLALGWAGMTDPSADEWLDWRQTGRWYYYEVGGGSPYSLEYVRDHSANVHIIPATRNVSAAVLQVNPDDFVLLEGLLVDVAGQAPVGFTFQAQTSLTRSDSGAGGCEILYLERLVVAGMEYR